MLIDTIELQIQEQYKERIACIVAYLKGSIEHCEVYLFGSYAKRCIKENSDIDLLVLIDAEMTLKEVRSMRIDLNSEYEEAIEYAYEVDIKVYSKKNFVQKTKRVSFEREISQYMIKVGEW